jgi:hypothetical protein
MNSSDGFEDYLWQSAPMIGRMTAR